MNDFGLLQDIHNEADVEQVFARRFIESLGYPDAEIRPKDSLTELTVGGLRNQPTALYRPDFAIKVGSEIRWILEAKSPGEDLDQHVGQPRGYCAVLNGEFLNRNPVEHFVLTNGILTRLYKWDFNEPLAELGFEDFVAGNERYESLCSMLARVNLIEPSDSDEIGATHHLVKAPIGDVNAAFSSCHQHIYRSDNISQAAAFSEFVKIVALKLLEDRKIKFQYPSVLAENQIELPSSEMKFTTAWIEDHEHSTANPLDTILFMDFIRDMEHEISTGNRKRIFDQDDHIDLSPETIKGVVSKLEHLFLFGIDADLNGRLFETFLNATMRGKDLGQYFTPRSLVKLGVGLGQLRVHAGVGNGQYHTDFVLDACCGTGGFLIDALADMWSKVNRNESLSDQEKDGLKMEIANNHICAIDVGRDPNLARIARLNMYLHGDGGSRVYHADALDKSLPDEPTDTPEFRAEKLQLRDLLRGGGVFDVVLTNPPFAKPYERGKETDLRILSEYEIATRRPADRQFRSSLLFFERYYDLLKIGGRLVSIIDDGILSGRDYHWFREFLRQKFLIRAVVSLPGDAFQRSKARVKTSFIVLEKRRNEAELQPAVFMYGCRYVGNDDPSRERVLPQDTVVRQLAQDEIAKVLDEFSRFQSGSAAYVVSPDRITDRLDVKHCLMRPGYMSEEWENMDDVSVMKLSRVVDLKHFPTDDIIECQSYEGSSVIYLRVRYDGQAESGDEIYPTDTRHSKLYRVRTGDIVISNIAASYGSVAVVPSELDGHVVSTEYTVLTVRSGFNPLVVWSILRSEELRADMLLVGTGANRTRIRWETIKDLSFPYPSADVIGSMVARFSEADEAERRATVARNRALDELAAALHLDQEHARHILDAFKPPR